MKELETIRMYKKGKYININECDQKEFIEKEWTLKPEVAKPEVVKPELKLNK